MMATEATAETFAKIPTIADHELNAAETTSEDVSSTVPIIDGLTEKEDSKQYAEALDSNVASAEVSVSGGSDTEASKAETTKSVADGKGHLRTDSKVKKPASFKSVPINKTFLAAKSSGTTTPSKLGDKTSVATTPAQSGPTTTTSRPRLIAKTGSGLRDSSSRASPAANGGKPGAPDGSVVWNKNRPAPAPEPKSYTDEELQQRYGIHLANRIQKDDGGKQANWADIDDDDDDWAPDSMEWSDGTKVTLPQVEEPAPVAPIAEPQPILKENAVSEPVKPRSPAPTSASTPPIKAGGLGSGRTGLVLKGAAEKPILVAKPPGPPAPVKSPWAPLPPVDKVAPVSIDIPVQSQQSRFGRPDPHGFGAIPPPPAKEIAADDFSRTWREGNSNTNRELFDSKSGRYEPVNDNRRGSRNDARHPALLQRSHQTDGPAEPSPAFQTNRASGQDSYGRRRTSSNVSGGSGNFARRMSRGHDMPPPHDMLTARRGSLAALSDDPSSPSNVSQAAQHSGQRGQPWQTRTSPAITHASPQSLPGQPVPPSAPVEQAPQAPYEDPIEEQKKIMRASRELAIKRRQEAEAKEEAEKKERLRLKLEALGPPPEKKSKKETPKQEKAVPVPVQIQSRTQGPPNETMPTGVEVPKVDESRAEEQIVKLAPQEVTENRANGNHILSSPTLNPQGTPDQQKSSGWQNNSAPDADRFGAPWAQQQPQHVSRNVWGPPTSDRSLGNGTFNQDLGGLSDMTASNPGPIGPPIRGNGYQHRGGREQNVPRPAPIGPPNRQTYSRAPADSRVAASGWANAAQIIHEDDRRQREEGIKANAERRELEAQGLAKPYDTPKIQETWRQVSIGEDGRRKVIATHVSVRGEENPSQIVKAQEDITTRPMFEDRSTGQDQEAIRHHNFDAIGMPQRQSEPWAAPRGSRFFPSQDVRLENRHFEEPAGTAFERPGSPLPPPPTMPGHPVYGENAFPQVHLPKPAPIVKLPPVLAPIGPPKPASFAAAAAAPVISARQDYRSAVLPQDIRRQEMTSAGWQDRINNLIGRKALSPPRAHAFQVDSASKNALEPPHTEITATVSLPSSSVGDLSIEDGSIVSKPAAEECFEEQEMGSLPIVKVPATAPVAAWNLSPTPKMSSRNLGLYDVVTISPDSLKFAFNGHIVNNTLTIYVKMPGQDESKTFSMSVPPQQHYSRRGGGRGGSRHASSSRGGGRGRDASGAFSSPTVPENGRGFNKERKASGWARSQR